MLEDYKKIKTLTEQFQPDVIVHLAAQAGVRYSLENPRSYINSNILGTFNIMEIAREIKVKHLLMASTSSVYGANNIMPFKEIEKADTQLTIYSATKKANESMPPIPTHIYGKYQLPCFVFSLFMDLGNSRYGALFKFVEAIIKDKPIDIYNNGDMYRDFTYVDDLVRGIRLLIDNPPLNSNQTSISNKNSQSPVAPFRIINIGNSNKVNLLDFVEIIESVIGKKAIRNYMLMGDVPATWQMQPFKENNKLSAKNKFKSGNY